MITVLKHLPCQTKRKCSVADKADKGSCSVAETVDLSLLTCLVFMAKLSERAALTQHTHSQPQTPNHTASHLTTHGLVSACKNKTHTATPSARLLHDIPRLLCEGYILTPPMLAW